MTAGRLEPLSDAESRLAGTLSLASVPALKLAGVEWLNASADPCVIDLADADFEGSAGVALLVAWLRTAHQVGKTLTFRNAPARLVRIAEVCGTAEMLGLRAGSEGDPALEGGQ